MTIVLGPHVVDGMYANNPSGRGIIKNVVRDLNPAWVNILRAQQPAEALATALEIRRDFPQTRVMVRHHFGSLARGDENVMQVFPNSSDYYRAVCSHYVGLDLTLVAGNEIGSDENGDWKAYVKYFLEVGELAGKDGLSLALCRTSAWHPYRPYHWQFEGFQKLYADFPFHVHSPNVYWTRQPMLNLDAMYKAIELWEYLGKPQMVIGEFARIFDFDPHKGFHYEKISQKDAANEMIDLAAQDLVPRGICAMWYSLGNWPEKASTFHTDEDFHREVTKRKGELQLATPVVIDPLAFYVQTTATNGLILRAGPSTNTAKVDVIPMNEIIPVYGNHQFSQIGNAAVWFKTTYAGRTGYVRADFTKAVEVVVEETISVREHEQKLAEQRGIYEARLEKAREVVRAIVEYAEELKDMVF